MTDIAASLEEALPTVDNIIKEGLALEKFRQMIKYQNGVPKVVDDYSLLPQARYTFDVLSSTSGYIGAVDALIIGKAAMKTGAGRQEINDIIDLAVGIKVKAKVGMYVKKGMPLAVLYANDNNVEALIAEVKSAFTIVEERVESETIIFDTVY